MHIDTHLKDRQKKLIKIRKHQNLLSIVIKEHHCVSEISINIEKR